ncbi:Vasohibin-1 [Phytophthora citrophthora]|uniref:Vasohibin-1 n=1 Tax=Phytophthora citrophthora TaxID=4793 RepID=A0AAD9LS35_9STRA|nr:Vasohibin-1 [Phytophthora citrophthora]
MIDELQDAWEKVKAMTIIPEVGAQDYMIELWRTLTSMWMQPPEPKLPSFGPKASMKSKLHAVQNVITSLEYNYTGTLYFDVNKNRSFKSIANTAKEILKEGLPIQCLEAVFLGAYLTAGFSNLDRFPISFKTKAGTSTHRHIVLGVRHQQQKWGALGLSRSDKLMNKEIKFDSLSDLVLDYCHEFQKVYHKVEKVNVGFPFSHDIHSSERVEWRVLNLPVDTSNWMEVAKQLDNFGKDAAEIESFKKAKGELPAWFGTKYALNAPEVELGVRSPRAAQRFNSFSDGYDEIEDIPAEESTPVEIIPKPITVTPDEFVFKRPSSSTAPAPPTNIFIQNSSPSPFLIEIKDNSSLLEIVTKTQPGLQVRQVQSEERDETIMEASPARAISTFRISANGMIVVAIKYNPLTKPSPPEKSSQKKKAAIADESAAVNEPNQVVSFRCIPEARSSENLQDAVPDRDTFTLETSFVFKDI